jgi:hypothetical protein
MKKYIIFLATMLICTISKAQAPSNEIEKVVEVQINGNQYTVFDYKNVHYSFSITCVKEMVNPETKTKWVQYKLSAKMENNNTNHWCALDNNGDLDVIRYDPAREPRNQLFEHNSSDYNFNDKKNGDGAFWTHLNPRFDAQTDYGAGFPIDKDEFFPRAEGLVLRPGRKIKFKDVFFIVAKQCDNFAIRIGGFHFRLIGKDGKAKFWGKTKQVTYEEFAVDNTSCFGKDKKNKQGKMSYEDSLAIYNKMKPTLEALDKLCKGFNIPGDSAYQLAKLYCESPLDFSEKGIANLEKSLAGMQALMGNSNSNNIDKSKMTKPELEAKIEEYKTQVVDMLKANLSNGVFTAKVPSNPAETEFKTLTTTIKNLSISAKGDYIVIDYLFDFEVVPLVINTGSRSSYYRKDMEMHIEEHFGNFSPTPTSSKSTPKKQINWMYNFSEGMFAFWRPESAMKAHPTRPSNSYNSGFKEVTKDLMGGNSDSETFTEGRKGEKSHLYVYSLTLHEQKDKLRELCSTLGSLYDQLDKFKSQ